MISYNQFLFLPFFLIKKVTKKSRQTRSLRAFCRASASTLPKIHPSDVEGLKGEEFALYDYFSGQLRLAKSNDSFTVSLPRMGYGLQYVVPVKDDFAAFGLVNKYNAPATIVNETWTGNTISIQLYEGGSFKAYSKTKPKKVLVNGKAQPFTYNSNILTVNLPVIAKPVISVEW